MIEYKMSYLVSVLGTFGHKKVRARMRADFYK